MQAPEAAACLFVAACLLRQPPVCLFVAELGSSQLG